MSEIHNLPTNIITGFLGSGKTTAINHLLAQKPADERWAVLVNEFGQVGIDEAQIPQGEGIEIRELAGGCFCCALGPALTTTLATLIRRTRPHRLLIEPTGLGHPSGIVDTLTSKHFADVIDLQAMICLIDPRNLNDRRITEHPVFTDQIQLADILVLNKADLSDPDSLARMQQEAAAIYPPKQAVITTRNGEIDASLLHYQPEHQRQAQQPDAHHHHHHHHHHPASEAPAAQPGQPVRLEGSDGQFNSCGWVFHVEQQFDPTAIFELLQSWPGLVRAKGVFRIGDMWISINRSGEECYSQPVSYRRDSRLELISAEVLALDSFEQQLLSCLC
ncbi:MAG: GTP-binding protein [Marinobacterium sp.]|nr:GTP-binding protein [Marinobacterium sp.]